MMRMRFFFWLSASLLFACGCSDPNPLGAGLLSQDQEEVFFSDTLSVKTEHFFQDSLISYLPSSTVKGLPFGTYEDDNFGTNTADFFFQITPGSLTLPVLNDFSVDSVLLTFEIDSVYSYGPFGDELQYELYEMTEMFNTDTNYFSNRTFEYEIPAITTGSFTPDRDSIKDLVLVTSDTLQGKFVSLELPNLFGKKLLDTALIANFDEEFFGLYMKNVTASAASSMVVFEPESGLTGVNVYYTDITENDTSQYLYRYLMSSIDVRVINTNADITGSTLEQAVSSGSDSLLYIQGLDGPDIKLSFPNLEDLGNILVNSAFIDLQVVDLPGNELEDYPPIGQLVLTYQDGDDFTRIDDVLQGIEIFGGTFAEETDISQGIAGSYRLNLSNYFQKIVSGEAPAELYLQVFPKIIDPARSILYGTSDTDRGPKLELTYTRINP
ncbi:MAG: DUF4270 family protein [Saprospiraceae bacterium]|nr:DUF4270 family protein [Saprospiraceae bacterium]